MNRYKYLLSHGLCAAMMTALALHRGLASSLSPASVTPLPGLDLAWKFAQHFIVSTALLFFLVIPAGFLIQYAYFRILCREPLERTYGERDACLHSLYVAIAVAVFLILK